MSEPNPSLSLKKSKAANISWAYTEDWPARTANARRDADERFLKLAGGDPKRAASLRKAHFQAMTIKSLAVRAAKKAAREAQQQLKQNGGAA